MKDCQPRRPCFLVNSTDGRPLSCGIERPVMECNQPWCSMVWGMGWGMGWGVFSGVRGGMRWLDGRVICSCVRLPASKHLCISFINVCVYCVICNVINRCSKRIVFGNKLNMKDEAFFKLYIYKISIYIYMYYIISNLLWPNKFVWDVYRT